PHRVDCEHTQHSANGVKRRNGYPIHHAVRGGVDCWSASRTSVATRAVGRNEIHASLTPLLRRALIRTVKIAGPGEAPGRPRGGPGGRHGRADPFILGSTQQPAASPVARWRG